MIFAVCDFAQNSEYLVTMVKVHNAETKVCHWTVILAFEVRGWFAQVNKLTSIYIATKRNKTEMAE